MGASEQELTGEDLTAIAAMIDRLREGLREHAVSPDAHAFIVSQIRILEQALGEYTIKGPSAFVTAFGSAMASYAEHSDLAEDEAAKPVIVLLGETWRKIRETVEDVDTVCKVGIAIDAIMHALPAVEHLVK